MPKIVVHDIEELDLRTVFPREDTAFTPWLAEPQNLARLSRVLGMELELVQTEISTGTFRTDILARCVEDDSLVIIENQFGRSDHDHLGKTLTYLAAHGAKTVVWIAERFADEHRAALSWLNDNTPDEIGFWAVAPKVVRIAKSPPGLRFEVQIRPNHFLKQTKTKDRQVAESVGLIRREFWAAFASHVEQDPVLKQAPTRLGGGAGNFWLMPNLPGVELEPEPHIAVYVSAPSGGNQEIGFSIWCKRNADESGQQRCTSAFRKSIAELPDTGASLSKIHANYASVDADLDTAAGIAAAIKAIAPALRRAYENMLAEFAEG